MQCPTCRFENREGVKFCEECGAKFELVCPSCQASVPLGRKFCGECGHSLIEPPKETSPIKYSEPQSYTPKYLADRILTDRSSIEGERKLVTVFFADVANYTSISENLDPEEVHQLLDGFFKILMDKIHKYEGTINQFTGDGVMALFGAPVAHEDHAQRACYAALSIQKAVNEYGEKVKTKTGIEFKIRTGINSGAVIVGSIGDDLRMDYTAVGDTTNLASRMEAAATPGSILISEKTHSIVHSYFEVNPLGKLSIKGKKESQGAYELIEASEITTRIEASIAKGLTQFVGRKNSTAAMIESWNKTMSGSGQIVGVVGEAGVGKSRLLLEFRNHLAQEGITYLEGRCMHYGSNMPYLPLLDIIKSSFDIKEDDRESVIRKKIKEKIQELDAKLADTIPPVQELLSLKSDDESFTELEAKQKREKTFEALRDLLLRLSENQPLILVVEDLHWIDNTSQEFLNYLIDWIAAKPVLLLLLYRPEYTHQWGSKSYYNRIGLDHLGVESSTKLVRAMLEGGEIAPDLRNLILERAAGNPLFMEEFTFSLKENGMIQLKDDRYVLSRNISELDVPTTVQDIIAARMDRMEDNLKRTMQVASVIGRDFAYRILQSITGMKEELKTYLLNLQGLEFIFEKNLFPELEYIFKHALTRDVAYNSLLQKRRREIHEQIGKAIEDLYPHRLEELYEMLAYHYSRSDNLGRAYHYLKLSGQKAYGNFSHIEAYKYFKQAINLLDQLPDSEDKITEMIYVRLLISGPVIAMVYPDDSLTILKEGERLSEKIGDTKSLANFHFNISSYYNFKDNRIMALKYAENAFYNAWKVQDIEMIAPTAWSFASACVGTEKWTTIIDVANRVIPLIEKKNRESDLFGMPFNPYSTILGYHGSALAVSGNLREGVAIGNKGLSYSKKINDILGRALIELTLGVIYIYKGDGKNTTVQLKNSLEHCEKANLLPFLGLVWAGLGYGYFLQDNRDNALEYIEKGLEIHLSTGRQGLLSVIYSLLADVLFASDILEAADQAVEKGLAVATKNNEKAYEGQLMIIKGAIFGKQNPNKYKDAEQFIQKGIGILKRGNLKLFYTQGYRLLGELYSDSNQQSKALEYMKKAEENFKDMEMDYWLEKTQDILKKL